MVSMKFDPDFGWIPVDAQGNYDAAADAAINAERAARGIDVRDPEMGYRPTVTTTGGDPSVSFGQITDPLITLANLAKDPGAIGRETGAVGRAADAFMKSIQEAAQKMAQAGQPDPLAAALATQGLTPSYQEVPQETGTPEPTLVPIDAPQGLLCFTTTAAFSVKSETILQAASASNILLNDSSFPCSFFAFAIPVVESGCLYKTAF